MAFENSYSNMCSQPDANNVPLLFSPTSPSEVSCDIDAAIASEILPFLFIGRLGLLSNHIVVNYFNL